MRSHPRRLPSASPYLSASGNRFQTSDSFLAPWVSDEKQKTDKHLLIASGVAIDADDYLTAAKFLKIFDKMELHDLLNFKSEIRIAFFPLNISRAFSRSA